MLRFRLLSITAFLCCGQLLLPQALVAQPSSRLIRAMQLPANSTNGVTASPDGKRIFMTVVATRKGLPQIAEWKNNKLVPYPSADWNTWEAGHDGTHAFQHANSIRFGPDGHLWVVDAGFYGGGNASRPKLVEIDTTTDTVTHIYDLLPGMRGGSFPNDVRFHGSLAYLTDSGAPGIIILNLSSGAARRVLDGAPAATATRPESANGRTLITTSGKPLYVHTDQLELSPNGATLYFSPACGPMYKIATRLLDDPNTPDADRIRAVTLFAQTGSTAGTAIDQSGNVYFSDTDKNAVYRITPQGRITLMVQDTALDWVDAMWIDRDGALWMPAAQMDHAPFFNGGKDGIRYPMTVFKLNIGIGPPPIDHR